MGLQPYSGLFVAYILPVLCKQVKFQQDFQLYPGLFGYFRCLWGLFDPFRLRACFSKCWGVSGRSGVIRMSI